MLHPFIRVLTTARKGSENRKGALGPPSVIQKTRFREQFYSGSARRVRSGVDPIGQVECIPLPPSGSASPAWEWAQVSKEVPLQGQRGRAGRPGGQQGPLEAPLDTTPGNWQDGLYSVSQPHFDIPPLTHHRLYPHTCVRTCACIHTHIRAHRCPKAYDQRVAHTAGL